MGLIETLRAWFKPAPDEEPLCLLPGAGQLIEFDPDEQAAVDSSLKEFHDVADEATEDRMLGWLQDGRYLALVSQISGQGTSDSEMDEEEVSAVAFAMLRDETEVCYILTGLKRAAYSRYAEGRLVHASQTCIKTLGMTSESKTRANYSGDGVAEIWFLFAHIHACAGKFRVAQRSLDAAKKEAKNDGAIYSGFMSRGLQPDIAISQSEWDSKVAALAYRIRSKTALASIPSFFEAEFRVRGKH